MKYTLYEELLDQKNILSHVFFNCAIDFIQEIADKNKNKTEEQIKKRKVDIELKIDGHICNPADFFNTLYEQYSEQVKKQATEIVKEQISEKFWEITNKLDDFKQIVDSWSEDINWNVDNLLKDKI